MLSLLPMLSLLLRGLMLSSLLRGLMRLLLPPMRHRFRWSSCVPPIRRPLCSWSQAAAPKSSLVAGSASFHITMSGAQSVVLPAEFRLIQNGLYQVRGLRINASSTFVLPQTSFVTLDVDAGHHGPRVGGVLLTTFGSISTVLGIVFTGVSFAVGNRDATTGIKSGASPGFLTAGVTMLGIGGAMMAGGITMLVLSRTTVRILGGSRLAEGRNPLRLALRADGLHF